MKLRIAFLAIAVVALASAFTTKKFAAVDLVFTGSTAVEGQVENESLWIEGEPTDCDATDNRACTIQIDETKLSGTAPNRFLNASIVTVNADQGGEAGQYKVTSLSGNPGSHMIVNKQVEQ